MIIRELYIKNFGKFSEQHFYLHDGLQVISGENEFGKSTIHAFIRAMLFGLERGRGRAAVKDDFTRYEPWDNPGYYAGVMRFSCGERNFRLERNFARANRQVSLVCEDDGEELSVEHGDLNMLLGGMTGELFDSTVSVGQLKSRPGEELAEALENYAADYLETGGVQIDLNRAVQILKEKKKAAARALREEKDRQEDGRRELRQECAYLERDMEDLQREYEEKQGQMEQISRAENDRENAGWDNADGDCSGAEKFSADESEVKKAVQEAEDMSSKSLLLAGAAGILIGILGLVWSGITAGLGASGSSLSFAVIAGLIGVTGVILLGCGIVSKLRTKNGSIRAIHEEKVRQETEDQEKKEKEKSAREKKANEMRQERKRLEWELARIQTQWKEKEIRRGNLQEQIDEFGPGEVQKTLEKQCRALDLAEEHLIRAGQEMSSRTVELVNRKASEIFAEITDGKYAGLSYDREKGFRVWDGTRQIPAERLSRGTLEQIWFAFRMAGAQALQEEPMPIILDETFAFYDDKRTQSALKWLRGQKKQVIIFTCHDARG